MDYKLRNINLYNSPRRKKILNRRIRLILLIIGIVLTLSILWSFLRSTSSVFNYSFPSLLPGSPFKSTDGRVNILMLGNAGGSHDGPYLTDSIIVASYQLKTHKVTLISIPRDLWVDSARAKINTLYEIGERRKSGLKYAEDKIDDILGIPIHYGVRVDFSGFEKAVDLVGGLDLYVPKTFDDHNYPIEGKEEDLCGLIEKEVELTQEQIKALNIEEEKLNPSSPQPTFSPDDTNFKRKYKVLVDTKDKIATQSSDFACRFERIHFEKGEQKMDGQNALKFVRSRQGTNGEGSDFARSRRQQIVLQSFRGKALSLKTLINPKTISELIATLGKSIETDIPVERYLDFYNLIKRVDGVRSLVLGDLDEGKSILVVPPPSEYGGSYVLTAPDNDFTSVRNFIKEKLEEDSKSK